MKPLLLAAMFTLSSIVQADTLQSVHDWVNDFSPNRDEVVIKCDQKNVNFSLCSVKVYTGNVIDIYSLGCGENYCNLMSESVVYQ